MEFDIYWSDLTPECQKRLTEFNGDNGNYDLIPIATVYKEENEDD